MKYLIVKCTELYNPYQCDIERFPMYVTDDWKVNAPDYWFEVYEILEGNTLKCIKKSYK